MEADISNTLERIGSANPSKVLANRIHMNGSECRHVNGELNGHIVCILAVVFAEPTINTPEIWRQMHEIKQDDKL